jgi:hypothetical protein
MVRGVIRGEKANRTGQFLSGRRGGRSPSCGSRSKQHMGEVATECGAEPDCAPTNALSWLRRRESRPFLTAGLPPFRFPDRRTA